MPKQTLILSGDHVYQMDYRKIIEFHRSTQAKVTIGVTPVKSRPGVGYGYVEMRPDGRVTSYEEKPEQPKSNLASLTIFVFETDYLLEMVKDAYRTSQNFQLYEDVLPCAAERGEMYAWVHEDCWAYARTIDMYYETAFQCVAPGGLIFNPRLPLFSNHYAEPASRLAPAKLTSGANVAGSVIGPGCVIEGTVKRSILHPGVVVKRGASVIDSIILDGTVIGEDCIIEKSIFDKNVQVGRRCVAGLMGSNKVNGYMNGALASGLNVIGKGAILPPGFKIEKNVMVFPGAHEFPTAHLSSGVTCTEDGRILTSP